MIINVFYNNHRTFMKKTFKIIFIICLFFNFTSCGIYKKVDARKVDPNAKKRAEKNIQVGKGFRLLDGARNLNRGGVFEFASSNPMWRASIKLLEFTPLSNVDYSGGIIITDWFYDEDEENNSVKITVKFLSNEIRADGIDVIVYKKICNELNKCKVSRIESGLEKEIKLAILKEAAILEQNERVKNPDFKFLERD
jgi:hypothetical protein